MKRTFQRLLTFVLSLSLLASFGALPASAVSDVAVTYDLSAEGATLDEGQNVLHVPAAGATVTVSFTMQGAAAYELSSMQNEIEYDMSFFELVPGSVSRTYQPASGEASTTFHTRTTGQEIVRASAMAGYGSTLSFGAEQVFCTFQLRVKEGKTSGLVRCSEAMASDTGYNALDKITERNLLVVIGDAPATTYSVTFNANGGSVSGGVPANPHTAGEVITLPAAYRSGYSFAGWSDGTTLYSSGAAYTVSADATLTAQWGSTITFSTGGGSLTNGTSPVVGTVGSTITLPGAKLVNKKLLHWSDGTNTYAAGSEYPVAGSVTLTAVWANCEHAHPVSTGTSTRYNHIGGSSLHEIIVTTTWKCDDCDAVLPSTSMTTGTAACTGTVGTNWRSNATQHWHHCDLDLADFDIADHVYDNDADTTCNVCGYTRTVETGGGTGGAGGGGGGTGGGGGAGGGSIVNPGGGTTTIVDNEVPLADVDSIIVTSLVDPATGASVSGERDENGHVVVTVKDAGGKVLDTVPGGVRVSFTIREGEVAILLDKNGNEIELLEKSIVEGQTAYVLVDGSCTIDIKYNAKPFDDVMPYDWFNSAVVFASSHELFQGVAEGVFAPNMPMTRGMLVTVLWRLENKPEDFATNQFPDVADGTWYTEAVGWAAKNGLVKGYDNGTFMPDRNISRQEMAAILYRYMNYLGYDTSAQGDLSAFADGESVSAWALPSVRWANGAGIITGKDGNRIDPLGNATRAEVATMFMRIVTEMVM